MSESIYKGYDIDQINELFSNFLTDSWSYSKVTAFARNEKGFEKKYLFGVHSKSSSITVAGQAYHTALHYYFQSKKEGKAVDLVELEAAAFAHIEDVPANYWKVQKTTPTVEECRIKATETVVKLLKNFIGEISVYEDDLAEVMDAEVSCEGFLTINGVDIPLPCHAKIDLVIRTKSGKVVIIDHKSKSAFTDDAEIALSIGTQAITYVKAYEEKTGLVVDEVWFIENKYSANKDKSPQLNCFKVVLDENTRKLYEALLYEPLKRMIEAVSDPDYVYLINESDNFEDKAELYDFWARTMICEVEDFNVEEAKKELISNRLKKIRDSSIKMITPAVIKNFKVNAAQFIQYDLSTKDMTQEQKIEHILRSFGVIVEVKHKLEGYSSNTYLLEVSAGVKIASVHSRKLDIANALNVQSVRISSNLVMYEGKSYIAVEHKKKRERDLIFDPAQLNGLRIPLGQDNYGNVIVWDLNNQSTPHALVCGATGSGKSVCITSVIEYAKMAEEIRNIIVFDPKLDFRHFNGDNGIVVVNEMVQIEEYVAKLVDKMNDLIKRGKKEMTLVIFDEYADAVDNARKGDELNEYQFVTVGNYANGQPKMKRECTGRLASLEENMKMLVQKGRSCGIRIMTAMQRASTKVITGDAKANYPVQICFRVPKEVDSRVVLDEAGAESLAGKGDGLIKSPEYNDTVRFQAYYKPAAVTA